MAEETKRGRGRPKNTEPKPKRDEKNPLEVIRQPIRRNSAASPDIPEGDNNKYTTVALAIMQMPKIDYRDPEQLRNRVFEYLQLCADNDMKPGVVALGLAIGINRTRLWEIRNGIGNVSVPQECKDIINTVYDSLEALWESYMQNGRINPVSGIFLAKNHFGYRDQQDYVVSPGQGDVPTRETIEAKYDELPD